MTSSRWADEWMRAWRSFPGASGIDPWTAAFDHFTRGNPAAYQRQFSEALAKITDQSRAFFDLGQALVRRESDGWQQAVFEYLDDLSDRLEGARESAQTLLGGSTLDLWRQFAGHEPRQGEVGRQGAGSLVSQIDQFLQMPGIGYTREHQESVQELSRSWLAYESAYGEYAAYCAETGRRSVEALRERLTKRFQEGDGPATIRDLYDAWVGCSEEIYAERVASEEYRHLHGRMVNALMAYRRQATKIMDRWAQAVNLPSREEVDALHRKLKETRQELNALKSRLAALSSGDSRGKSARGSSSRGPSRKSGRPATTTARRTSRKRGGKAASQ